jgi:hypothetical protein
VDKNGEGIANTEAHLNCHEIREESATQDQTVSVSTQFGVHQLEVVNAVSLCLPTTRDGVGSADGQNAYVCYQRGQFVPAAEVQVRLEDDLEGFSRLMWAKPPPMVVCNPVSVSVQGDLVIEADPADAGEDHLACFQVSDVEGEPAFVEQTVQVSDVLTPLGGDSLIDLVRARLLCERAKVVCETCL